MKDNRLRQIFSNPIQILNNVFPVTYKNMLPFISAESFEIERQLGTKVGIITPALACRSSAAAACMQNDMPAV